MAMSIAVEERNRTGGGAPARLRREGRLPGVLYGKGIDPVPLSLNARTFEMAIRSQTGRNTLLQLESDSDKLKGRLVLVKVLDYDPMTSHPIHTDLIEVKEGQPLRVTVPVELIGKPIGLVKNGIIQQTSREIQIECLPTQIPPSIKIDISALDLGHSIHIADVILGEGVKAIYSTNTTIVTCVTPEAEEKVVVAAPTEAQPAAGAAAAQPAATASKAAATASKAAATAPKAPGKEGKK